MCVEETFCCILLREGRFVNDLYPFCSCKQFIDMILSLAQLFFFDIKSTDYQKKFPCGQKQIQLVNTCHYGRLSSKCLYIFIQMNSQRYIRNTHTGGSIISRFFPIVSSARRRRSSRRSYSLINRAVRKMFFSY